MYTITCDCKTVEIDDRDIEAPQVGQKWTTCKCGVCGKK